MKSHRILTLCVIIISGLAHGSAVADAKMADAKPLGPLAIVATRDGKTLYVANHDARHIAIVDPAARKTSHPTIAVPASPTSLAFSPDETKLYVACAAPKSVVAVIDTASRRVLSTIPVGHTATGIAITPDGKRLFVCNRFNNDVSVVDLVGRKEVARVPATREPIAVAVTPDGRTAVVANLISNDPSNNYPVGAVATLIDTKSLQTKTIRLPEGSGSLRDVCISPDGRYAVVTHILSNLVLGTWQIASGWINTNAISVIDLKKKEFYNHALLDDMDDGAANPWGVRFSPDGKLLVVAHAGVNELSVIEFEPLIEQMRHGPGSRGPMAAPGLIDGLRRRIAISGRAPRGIAIAGPNVYAAEYFSDTIAAVDYTKKASPRTIRLGPKPTITLARRGEMLFNDATFCFQRWQSCASCHPDARSDAINWDLMNDGGGTFKNAKSLLLAHSTAPSMALAVRDSAEQAVRAGIEYILFAERPEEDAVAIDAYLKSLKPTPSPHLVDGQLSESAKRGKRLFGHRKVGCTMCHPAPLFTDQRMHHMTPLNSFEIEEFDTPTLVEVWRTAPYRHDGKFSTVKELLTDGKHGHRRGGTRDLTEQEIDDLVEYVESL